MINIINKFNFTKIFYVIFSLIIIITIWRVPHAFRDGDPHYIRLMLIPHFALYYTFFQKFKGSLQMTPLTTFLSVCFIINFIPTIYFYMLRSGFFPSLLHIVIMLAATGGVYLSLLLDSIVFKYEIKEVTHQNDNE